VTGILDEELWWNTLKLVVEFLRAKAVEEVRVEFGFVLDRDLAGKEQGGKSDCKTSRFGRLHQMKVTSDRVLKRGRSSEWGPQTSSFIRVVRFALTPAPPPTHPPPD
jgi:hypothetical protein